MNRRKLLTALIGAPVAACAPSLAPATETSSGVKLDPWQYNIGTLYTTELRQQPVMRWENGAAYMEIFE